MRAPPTTQSLDSIDRPSMSSMKNFTYLLTRERIRIPCAFLSLMASYWPYSAILLRFPSSMKMIFSRMTGNYILMCLMSTMFMILTRYCTPIF